MLARVIMEIMHERNFEIFLTYSTGATPCTVLPERPLFVMTYVLCCDKRCKPSSSCQALRPLLLLYITFAQHLESLPHYLVSLFHPNAHDLSLVTLSLSLSLPLMASLRLFESYKVNPVGSCVPLENKEQNCYI